MRMRTVIATGVALVFLAGCGGETTSATQQAASDGASDAPSAAQGMSSGGAGVRNAQSDAALEAPRPDGDSRPGWNMGA
jgi:hypothetical protein